MTLLILAGAAAGLLGCLMLWILQIATTENLAPATVDPFAGANQGRSSSDTVPMTDAMAQTVLPPKSDWQTQQLASLTDVEDLLDYLDVHGVETREVVILGDACFQVRWKA